MSYQAEREYSTLTVLQLKGLLKERSLKVSGKKIELIARLEEFEALDENNTRRYGSSASQSQESSYSQLDDENSSSSSSFEAEVVPVKQKTKAVTKKKPPARKRTGAAAGPKPKRGRSAYNFYQTEKGAHLRALPEHQGKSMVEINKLIAAQWKLVSKDERRPYQERAKKDKEEASARMKAWTDAGGKQTKRKVGTGRRVGPKKSKVSWDLVTAENSEYLETTGKYWRIERVGSSTRVTAANLFGGTEREFFEEHTTVDRAKRAMAKKVADKKSRAYADAIDIKSN